MKTTIIIRRFLLLPIISLVVFNLAFKLQDPAYKISSFQVEAFVALITLFFITYIIDEFLKRSGN
ncbi:MAG: hypothetical protein JWR02_93 [Mucilaginibacter sp.]|nr:hypothetical protein [Mucilaginibacter sp.]